MRKNRLIYTLVLVACIIFSIAYQSRISSVLLFTVAAYPIPAFLLTLVQLFCVKADFAEKRSVVEKNKQFDIGIYISNGFIFAYAPLELLCFIPDIDTGLFLGKKIFASLSPLGKTRVSAAAMHKYRGSYTARIDKITVYDPLRIIRLSRREKSESTLVFLPRRIRLGELVPVTESEQSMVQLSHSTGEKDDFSHVRGYLPGDIIQQIHWKLTAKADELMIKQYEEINEQKAVILCDLGIDASGAGLLMRTDAVIETAIAFAMSCSDANVRTEVDFGAVESDIACDITGKTGFERFFELMSVIPAGIEVIDFAALTTRHLRSGASAVFLITGQLSDELYRAAQLFTENGSLVVVAYTNPFSTAADERFEHGRFYFLNICGDTEKALQNASEELSDNQFGR